jgi:transcriptional regulator with XRE-family HTH domain
MSKSYRFLFALSNKIAYHFHMTIGERIKEQRVRRGWTLRELAKQSGVSHVFIWQVEQGRGIGTERLILIAKALRVRASKLLGE